VVLPPVPANRVSAITVPDPTELQDTVTLAQEVEINRYNADYDALRLGNHVLGVDSTRPVYIMTSAR
jgi:hypothetical protein